MPPKTNSKGQELYTCECGAEIVNKQSYIKKHYKTSKHQNFLATGEVWEPECKADSCESVKKYRENMREEMGDEEYKEKVRNEMRQYRLKKKMEKVIAQQDNKEENEDDEKREDILPKKVIDRDTMIDFMKEMLDIIDKEKKERDPIVIKEYIKNAILTFRAEQLSNMKNDELVEKLPRISLVNPLKTIDKKTNQQNIDKIKLLYKYIHNNDNFQPKDLINPTWLEDTKNVKKKVKENTTTAESQRAYYTAVLSTLTRIDQEKYQSLIDTYRALQKDIQTDIFKIRQANLRTLREKRNWMNWNDIVKYTDKNWTSRDKLIKALYTCIPPRRLEYGNLILAEETKENTLEKMEKKSDNYLVLKGKEPYYIILNRYKTWKRYGTYTIDLQNKAVDDLKYLNYKCLLDAVKVYLKDNKKMKVGDYIFGQKYGSDFGKELNKVWEGTSKQISVDILRHSFITNFVKKISHSQANDAFLKQYSDAMGHSSHQFLTYRKLDDDKLTEKFIEDEEEVELEELTEKVSKKAPKQQAQVGRKVNVHYAEGWFKGTIASIDGNEAIINFDNGEVEGVDFPFDMRVVKYIDDEQANRSSKMTAEHRAKISASMKASYASKKKN
jgi:hypothetical protein